MQVGGILACSGSRLAGAAFKIGLFLVAVVSFACSRNRVVCELSVRPASRMGYRA